MLVFSLCISIMHGGFSPERACMSVCVPTDLRLPRGGLTGLKGMYAQREVAYLQNSVNMGRHVCLEYMPHTPCLYATHDTN